MDKMYFIHSYFVKLKDQNQILSETQYGNLNSVHLLDIITFMLPIPSRKKWSKRIKILNEFKKIFKL